jgi:plastocyanin
MRRLPILLLPLAVISVAVAGCGSDGKNGGDLTGKPFTNERGKRAVTVEMVDNNFDPAYVEVSRGTTVTFLNSGHNPHDVISVGDAFTSSGVLSSGGQVQVTFTDSGDYSLYCSLHGSSSSGMTGGVRVVD